MDKPELARHALASYDRLLQLDPGLRPRPGQRLMAEQVAQTFSLADLGPTAASPALPGVKPERAVAVIQAGTGVGKSLAYCAPALAMALQRNTRLLISTATVALQEQLVHKDLPALAAQSEQPFRFALAKGRGRYVCKLKLERQLSRLGGARTSDGAAEEDVHEDDWFLEAQPAPQGQSDDLAVLSALQTELASGRWGGDLDTLSQAPDGRVWQSVAVQASSCAARHCPVYHQCSYFQQRKELVGAQVIVVNHDLLLSTLGSRTLPELDNCLLVIDEAHHLPAVALEQFASRMDLSRLGWIERLAQRALRTGASLGLDELAAVPGHAAALRSAMQELARLVVLQFGTELGGVPLSQSASATAGARQAALAASGAAGTGFATERVARLGAGQTPPALLEPLNALLRSAGAFIDLLRLLAKALRAEMRDQPQQSRQLATQYAQLGSLTPRLEAAHETARLLLQQPTEGAEPVAKWFGWQSAGADAALMAHASPTLPGSTLRQHLWGSVRTAVLTSATLSSGGRFDYFLRESGLDHDPDVCALEVPSPFDFSRQGRIVLASTRADPKDASAFNAELVCSLMQDLACVRHGALVLFTSRLQLRLACEALPPALRPLVLVQNELPRQRLLRLHTERVATGQPSIIFGMQTFGEGLDLPGRLCEDLFITKLPFAPPDDPVGQARAEWLRAAGRDPFQELVLPAAAIRLAQWVGRAIRTEDDRAQVYCYDRRLHQSRFGQQLLAGLPPFERVLRPLQSAFAPL
ncbi:Rad3-related DNA helicase [Serpentinimonas raichei]|uniref:ATP-dependent DNA helicase DinG n=1 Tax=Serpentinimonas raichei TaxID=1458425 RepID=A0A060NG98_9BURK|nr:ATP-dependent DNA helicase DinG [Serpentinimonas raichei]BAO80736.1 Rad3-related DNA helicase [Serpentinimonas raichei]